MSFLSGKSIITLTIIIVQIYHATGNETANSPRKINENPSQNLRKHTFCPSLVRTNNWEIEEFFGDWSGIELYSHKTQANENFQDTCMRINIAEVNEQNEEMTYGKPIDYFNFRLALRHLKVSIYTNNIESVQYILTFNNTKQMLWYGDNISMQIIKFDRKQMMLTVCAIDKGEMYTILSNRYDENRTEYQTDSTHLNRLILKGRNLKIHSQFDLQTNCSSGVETFLDKNESTEIELFENVTVENVYLEDVFQNTFSHNMSLESGCMHIQFNTAILLLSVLTFAFVCIIGILN
ncbi:uncharacterized protein [Chironomus tepperi]|uniref:uncharacterized protein n=1 Tax=Chironomus tepperi TaxID=113505 RepID=UPI00391FC59E